MNRAATAVAALLTGALLLAGCTAGGGAVAQGGSFQLVSPGGRTEIFYPPARRGTVGQLSGPGVRSPSNTVSLRALSGRVVVLNVWGSWCGPCRDEADDLQRIHRLPGVSVLGIDFRDDRQAAADFRRAYGLTYPSIYDPPGRTLFALDGIPRSVVPLTVVLDRRHRVAAVFLRKISTADLRPVVGRLAATP